MRATEQGRRDAPYWLPFRENFLSLNCGHSLTIGFPLWLRLAPVNGDETA